tara:strand:- start:172 stop:501 length:330 start_codon:yes stop_codon:yes gene_type:complete
MTLNIYDIMINAGYRRDMPADSKLFPYLSEGYFIDKNNITARKFIITKEGNILEHIWDIAFPDIEEYSGNFYYDLQELSLWYNKASRQPEVTSRHKAAKIVSNLWEKNS